MSGSAFCRFLFPTFSNRYLLRMGVVALLAWLFFSEICIPIRISGTSMEPTYRDGSFNLIWRPTVLFSELELFDVVAVRLAGRKVMLLKRVVAFEGDTVEFREGKLFVNGNRLNEPYVRYPCKWTLSPRRVDRGKVYVLGDNRQMPIKNHIFGQTELGRIVGVPLW